VTSSLDVKLNCEDANDCISCFDEDVFDEFINFIACASLNVVLAFGGSNERISSFDKEIFIESLRFFVTSSLGVELTCREDEGFISGFREVVNELIRPAFTFGTELAGVTIGFWPGKALL